MEPPPVPDTAADEGFAETLLGWTTADADAALVTLRLGTFEVELDDSGGGIEPTAPPPEPPPPPCRCRGLYGKFDGVGDGGPDTIAGAVANSLASLRGVDELEPSNGCWFRASEDALVDMEEAVLARPRLNMAHPCGLDCVDTAVW